MEHYLTTSENDSGNPPFRGEFLIKPLRTFLQLQYLWHQDKTKCDFGTYRIGEASLPKCADSSEGFDVRVHIVWL